MVRGIPRRVDKGPSMIFDDGSRWSSPVYTCASAIKATIKTVTFFHNDTTDNIDNLAIKGVKEKEYPDDRSMPLWGVENWSYTLGQYDPVWGLVDGTYEHFDKVTTIRQPYLYLIGTSEQRYATFQPSGTFMNLPGTIAPFVSMTSVSAIGTTDLTTVADFTARTGMSLWMKWRNLTGSADTTPQIIKLLWTDLAASAMVGTKGILGAGNAHLDSAVEIPVTPTVHRVTFDYAYAVPAFVTLFCMVIVLVLLIVSIARGRASIKIMDQRLKQTSIGRSLTTLFSPESSSFVMPSKDWSGTNGHRMLDLRMGLPIPLGPSGGTGPTQSSTFYSKMGSKPAWAEGLSPTETFGDDVELVQQNPSSRG